MMSWYILRVFSGTYAMFFRKLISFHPRLAAILDLVVGALLLWWLTNITTPLLLLVWFVFRVAWWGILQQCMFYPAAVSRVRHFFSLVVFNIGLTALLVFMDAQWTWELVGSIYWLVPSISFWLVPKEDAALAFALKPHRRWRFLMVVIGLMGMWSGLYSIAIFQLVGYQAVALFIMAAALGTVAVSAWWWREYGIEKNKIFLLHLAALFVVVVELAGAILLWPTGYLINGLVITWLWYLTWLLLRFHLSPEGIAWEKQKRFFVVNAFLLVVFLVFIARWR